MSTTFRCHKSQGKNKAFKKPKSTREEHQVVSPLSQAYSLYDKGAQRDKPKPTPPSPRMVLSTKSIDLFPKSVHL